MTITLRLVNIYVTISVFKENKNEKSLKKDVRNGRKSHRPKLKTARLAQRPVEPSSVNNVRPILFFLHHLLLIIT